jgi:predicted DNA repair protein MutK
MLCGAYLCFEGAEKVWETLSAKEERSLCNNLRKSTTEATYS